jgi:type I restriction-modification system DNA methylase subunit
MYVSICSFLTGDLNPINNTPVPGVHKGSAWKDFIAASKKLNGIYDGIVFKQHAILDAPDFKVDDNEFANICEKLAHVNSPYDFNSIPIHILGSIYERFLGKVIVTTDKRARLEEKPEVRKAGGVYYTPEYIVRYIVENTVGKQIEGKTPAQIAEMRFADIACGSGSFLLGVLDLLLRHHGKWFNAHPKEAKKAGCVPGADGAWHLSLKQRREILLNNIYGVDIDHQAVEVAQLSLYLKLLEEETTSSARNYQQEFHETLLPSLNKNIVCGNSLIGTDILIGQLFASDEERKLNPMDYEQRFPEIMKRGGFDAIVGNPPWVDIKGLSPSEVDYYFAHYDTVTNRMNLYAVFMHRAWSLIKTSGFLGYITPNSFLTQSSYAALRRMFLKGRISTLIRTPDNVFDGVIAEACISVLEKQNPSKQMTTCVVYPRQASLTKIYFPDATTTTLCNQSSWMDTHDCIFNLRPTGEAKPLLDKIQSQGKPLMQLCDFCLGLTPYDKYKGHTPEQIAKRVFHSTKPEGKTWKKLLDGGDIQRYCAEWSGGAYINYGPWLGAPREDRFFTQPRILVRQIISGKPPRIYAAYTKQELYNTQVAFSVLPSKGNPHSILYLLGLINSRLMTWYHRQRYLDPEKYTFQKILIQDAKLFPAHTLNLKNSADKAHHDKMVSLVEQMLAAKKQLAAAQSDRDKDFYGHKCESLDRQIDALVYELYGLTEAEISIVEGGNLK